MARIAGRYWPNAGDNGRAEAPRAFYLHRRFWQNTLSGVRLITSFGSGYYGHKRLIDFPVDAADEGSLFRFHTPTYEGFAFRWMRVMRPTVKKTETVLPFIRSQGLDRRSQSGLDLIFCASRLLRALSAIKAVRENISTRNSICQRERFNRAT